MEKHWLVRNEDEPSSVWIVIASTADEAVKKFCQKLGFPESDFDDAFGIHEEKPIC